MEERKEIAIEDGSRYIGEKLQHQVSDKVDDWFVLLDVFSRQTSHAPPGIHKSPLCWLTALAESIILSTAGTLIFKVPELFPLFFTKSPFQSELLLTQRNVPL